MKTAGRLLIRNNDAFCADINYCLEITSNETYLEAPDLMLNRTEFTFALWARLGTEGTSMVSQVPDNIGPDLLSFAIHHHLHLGGGVEVQRN